MISRQLITTLSLTGTLSLSLQNTELPPLGAEDILLQVQAAPLNPSDMSFMFTQADLSTLTFDYDASTPCVSMQLPDIIDKRHQHRVEQTLPCGYEGAGVIIEVGSSLSRELIGRTVSCAIGGMYADYKVSPLNAVIVMPEGVTPMQAAAAFVNPMTVLAMLETRRLHQHKALVHTASASNLGKILIRCCKQQSIPLVNLVRNSNQIPALMSLGADIVLDTSDEDFAVQLYDAISQYEPTACFDPIAGGDLLSHVMSTMERVFIDKQQQFSHYGSGVFKQGFVYGHLDNAPLRFTHQIGFSWSLRGWLLGDVLPTLSAECITNMKKSIQSEITTTFASEFNTTITLADILNPVQIATYTAARSNEKFLVVPG